ncbi:MAG: serine--tRNA ligase [Planctomycetes bacterium]|nr:serine--tRNA ligase [Planctomycetota bacterium]
MLDIRLIRDNADAVRDACRRKRIDADVDKILELDQTLRDQKTAFDAKKGEQNKRSKEIGKLPPEERAAAAASVKALSEEIKELDNAVKDTEAALRPLLMQVPNLPSDDVPDGADDTDNVELRTWGVPTTFDFEPKDHVELGLSLDILDIERATRIAGSRTYFLKNEGALLELAVLRFALDHMIAKGFSPMLVPHLVRTEAMEGTAYLPGGEEQAYRTMKDESWLIGTAEVPLTSYRMGEILEEAELPLKTVGLSQCFRREAGTYGKDTRGLYRIHQFQKVEQVVVCRADEEESLRWHHEILANSEEVMQALGLPYRVVNVCSGDLGRPQIQKFDIETWMPGRDAYGETHSASRFHDFQARRLNIRYRSADKKPSFCHTLNNTVVASPRVLIPILECYQQKDGSVVIPEALRPYMGGQELIEPKA